VLNQWAPGQVAVTLGDLLQGGGQLLELFADGLFVDEIEQGEDEQGCGEQEAGDFIAQRRAVGK